jgi:orotate phosphoribosyltransferase-like protein
MNEQDNCNPNDGVDWAEMDFFSVMGAAKSGVPGAVAQKEKMEKELELSIIDTVSSKALDPAQINIQWIEE